MASCFVPRVASESVTASNEFTLLLPIIFTGTDVPNGADMSETTVAFLNTDTAVQMRNKVTTALIAEAIAKRSPVKG